MKGVDRGDMRNNIKAELVVLGKIFTSEENNLAEALAIKDGKYIYVGDRNGVKELIDDGKTQVIDYTNKGMVMPSCGNAHAHYLMGYAMLSVGALIEADDTPEKFLNEILPAAVKKAKDNGTKTVFGFGWEYMRFLENMPTRQQIDAVCPDMPVYFADEEGHKGLANTMCLVKAGIMTEDGTVLKSEVRGGEIVMGDDGTPTGLLKEQAGTYVRSFLDNDNLVPVDVAKSNMYAIQQRLLSEGYTMYMDGWSSYFNDDRFYRAAQEVDKAGDLHFILGMSHEIESWMDVDKSIDEAIAVKKYASKHIVPGWVKLFIDGTVEGTTGFVEPLYPDGHQGLINWTEEEVTNITKKANENGLSMHIHTMGNMAVNRAVSGYANGGKDEMRNTLVHVHGVIPSDYQRMAEHNMCVVAGTVWHSASDELVEELKVTVPEGMADKSYPMKSFFDNGINTTSHTDYPATSGGPDDPFGLMEIAVTGMNHTMPGKPWWPEELLTRVQMLRALTINCARQMFIEEERGSIKEGKYADFLLIDKDVLTCPSDMIHETKVNATYFEGEKVY